MVELPAQEGPDSDLVAIERMIARGEPFDSVMAAIGALEYTNEDRKVGLQRLRLTAVSMYRRPDQEIAAELDRFVALDMEPWRRLQSVLAACARSAALFQQYAEPLVKAGECNQHRDEPLERVLDAARALRSRLAAGE
jgi:hypothetical protein